jgi:hypothetical protein
MKKMIGFLVVLWLSLISLGSILEAREPILGDPKVYFSNAEEGTYVFNFLRSIPVPAGGELVCYLYDPLSEQWGQKKVERMDLPFLREFFLNFTAEAGILPRENPASDPRFADFQKAFIVVYAAGGSVEIENWWKNLPIDIKIGVKLADGTVDLINPADSDYAFPADVPEFFRIMPGNNTGDSVIFSIIKMAEGTYRVYFDPDFYQNVDGTFRVEGGALNGVMTDYKVEGGERYPYFEVTNQSVFAFNIFLDVTGGGSLKYDADSDGKFYLPNLGAYVVDFGVF